MNPASATRSTLLARLALCLAIVASAFILAACADFRVVTTSEGTYQVEATAQQCVSRFSAAAKAQIKNTAEQYCEDQGRHLEVIDFSGDDGTIGEPCASANLQFVCSAD